MPRPTQKAAAKTTKKAATKLVAVEVPAVERAARKARFDAELLDAALEMLKTSSVNLNGNQGQDTKTKARRLANLARKALIDHGKLNPDLLTGRVYSEDDGKTWTYGLTLGTEPPASVAV